MRLREPLPPVLVVGEGTALVLEGQIEGGARVRDLRIRLGECETTVDLEDLPPPDRFTGAGWWQAVVPVPAVERPHRASLVLLGTAAGGDEFRAELGTLWLEPRPDPALAGAADASRVPVPDGGELVAICLATHEPPVELLRRQLDSIRGQTHPNWICVVSDDASSEQRWEEIRDAVGDDPRFILSRSATRLGFYENFERALMLAPREASYVALADQDDRWHEDKLSSLIAALGDDRLLAHSDARVVDEEGRLLAEGIWGRGRPRDDDLGAMLLASAVPGAASLFRRSLLDSALPFPPAFGDAFHDRWLALVAVTLGRIAYVPRPLYDYVQHGAAALGHAGTTRASQQRQPAWRRRLARLRAGDLHPDWRGKHDNVVTRTRQEACVLELRFGARMSPRQRRAVRRVELLERAAAAPPWLAARHAGARVRGRPGLEGELLRGITWRRVVPVRGAIADGRRRLREGAAPVREAGRDAARASLRGLVSLRVPLPRAWTGSVHVPASPSADLAMRRALAGEAHRGSESGPMVSLVVPSRDGLHHLERLLPGLERTRYRPFELIVVDNGSTDGTADWLAAVGTSFPATIVAGEAERSFSQSINSGVAAANGELVLLLNNDVEPANPEWLGLMVETLLGGADCVGARLVYPRRPALDNQGDEFFADLTVQHRGIHFVGGGAGIPVPRNLGAGEDPRAPAATAVARVPAVTAACMLLRRGTFERLGGLDEDYLYGTEDTDLCLRLRRDGGEVVCDGRAVLFHHEYGTQNAAGRGRKRRNRLHNRRRFVGAWGVPLFREVLLDRLRAEGRWSHSPLRIGIVVTRDSDGAGYGDLHTGRELADELRHLSFDVELLEHHRDRWRERIGQIDALIVLLDSFPIDQVPGHVVSVAWVRNWTERWIAQPWFDDYDIVLASSAGSKRLIDERSSRVAEVMPLATNPERFAPERADPALAGDVLFAGNHWGVGREVDMALPALARDGGLEVSVYGRGWETVPGMDAIHRGRLAYERLPGAYAAAGIVIDDSAPHTRPYGSVNSRVFDALASGALVITNDAEGVRALFDADFPAWADSASLRERVRELRGDPERVTELVARYRAIVLERHTYRNRALQVREALERWCAQPRVGICIGVPASAERENWGDHHFARSLQRELEERGHPARVHLLAEWEREYRARDDVCLHLFGLSLPELHDTQLNALWNISHPELVTGELLDSYDLALIASDSFAAEAAARTTTPVAALHQATDPRRFHPGERAGGDCELLFVGNSRDVERPIVTAAARSGHRLAVYGQGWTPDLLDPRLVAGETIPNSQLHRYYSAAAIVLNDHWSDMRERGFISNRIYDALACGACVVSDAVDGMAEEFDDAVVVWDGREELGPIVEPLLADPRERRRRGARGRAAVLARHTFSHRAEALIELLRAQLSGRAPVVARPAQESRTGSEPLAGSSTSAS